MASVDSIETQLVVISDDSEWEPEQIYPNNPGFDRTEKRHTEELIQALNGFVEVAYRYQSPKDFIDNIRKHENHLVLPNWFGERSRNRFALIPAICEAQGIQYIGADAYCRFLCNDKSLSKIFCRRFGFLTPKSITVNKEPSPEILGALKLPLVVKPNMENSSMFITDRSLCKTYSDVISISQDTLYNIGGDVIIEEFVAGREVSLCLLGNAESVKEFEAGERYVLENEGYLINRLFDFDLKKGKRLPTAMRLVTNELLPGLRKLATGLFLGLGKTEMLRIDGRLDSDGQFWVIELTPDTHLGARAEFAGTFIAAGMSYTSILKAIIVNSLNAHQRQESNNSEKLD